MEPEIILLREVRHTETNVEIAYLWNQKKSTNECTYKTETDSQT